MAEDPALQRPEDFFEGSPLGLEVLAKVRSLLEGMGSFDVRVSKSQVAFRHKRGIAYLWKPGQYLAHPHAEVVLSIPLGRHDASPRFKEVVHPSPLHWMHHLEIREASEIDDEVEGWLREAFER